jgi:signal peptidase I
MMRSLILLVLAVLVALSITVLPMGVGSKVFKVPTGGMDPAVAAGDHVYVNFRAYRSGLPARGDIAVYWTGDVSAIDTLNGKHAYFLQRVVALPGEKISIVDGKLTVNGVVPPELQGIDYVVAGFPNGALPAEGAEYLVPQDHIFVLGDNTHASYDGRYWGPLPVSALRGRAEACLWPPNRLATY